MDNLENIRKLLKISKKEMAGKLNVTPSYYTKLANESYTATCSRDVFVHICKTLDLPPCLFLCNDLKNKIFTCRECKIGKGAFSLDEFVKNGGTLEMLKQQFENATWKLSTTSAIFKDRKILD